MSGRVIEGAILTSTRIDAHGVQIPRDELRALCERMPSVVWLNDGHDPSRCPVGRATNFRFVEQRDGHAAIICDVEVHDETHLPVGGGLSIAVIEGREGHALLEIIYDSQAFSERDIAALIPDQHRGVVSARAAVNRGVGEILIITLKFGVASFMAGFLRKAGSDGWDALKPHLIRFAERVRRERGRVVQFHVSWRKDGDPATDFVVRLTADELERLGTGSLTLDAAEDVARVAASGRAVAAASLKVNPSQGQWAMCYLREYEGRVVRFED